MIAIAFLILAVISAGCIIYLNQFLLPVKIKSLIIQAIEKETGKKAELAAVRFNLFKGIVLSSFRLHDGGKNLISFKEASCSFLILPILKEKKIIIPGIRIREPEIFLKRNADNTFNLMELLPEGKTQDKNQPFGLIISGITLINGHVDFQDDTFTPAFAKAVDDINLSASLSLPTGIKFNCSLKIQANPSAVIDANGEFHLLTKELTAKIYLKGLSPKEFSVYYSGSGLSVKDGVIDLTADIKLKDNLLNAGLTAQTKKLAFSKDKIFIKADSGTTANLSYNLKDKGIKYSGKADIAAMDILGIETIREINNISGRINFSETGLTADKITASLLGFQVEARISLSDFANPKASLQASSDLDLNRAGKVLLEKFKIAIPAELNGQGKLLVTIDSKLPIEQPMQASGSLKVISGTIKPDALPFALININGTLEFNLDSLKWSDVAFDYLNSPYKTSGMLTDFKSPAINLELWSPELKFEPLQQMLREQFKLDLPAKASGTGKLSLGIKTKLPVQEPKDIQLKGSIDLTSAAIKIDKIDSPAKDITGRLEFTLDTLSWTGISFNYLDAAYSSNGNISNFRSPAIDFNLSSDELQLKSRLNLLGKQIKISGLEAKFLDSRAWLQGNIDISNAKAIGADISADLNIDLEDIKKPLNKFKDTLEQLKPGGLVKAKVSLNGTLNDFKNCAVEAKLSASLLSAYGLKAEEFLLDYRQSGGLADIPLMRLSMYEGTIDANAKINLDSENIPFWINTTVQGVKIERLKQDTPIKDQDISGTIEAITKVNGFINDFGKMSGSGKILIRDGRLWQLNLFKGLGELLFTEDFANIVFSEGYCEFFIKDKFVFTDNLQLKSNLVNLEGKGKVGFDNSLEATINAQMGESAPAGGGGIKDITTAIIGQAGKFGVIKLSGTLQNPKFKFQPAVADVIKGLKDTILGSIFGQ